MNQSKRQRFLAWLTFHVFKTPMGQIPNKFIRFIEHVLYPMRYRYLHQQDFQWLVHSNHYIIQGYKVSARNLFEFLNEKGEKQTNE